jgi:hypothetical protein
MKRYKPVSLEEAKQAFLFLLLPALEDGEEVPLLLPSTIASSPVPVILSEGDVSPTNTYNILLV